MSRYFDRITRPEQLISTLPQVVAGADRPRRLRAGRAGAAAGRPGRGVRLPGGDVRSRGCTGSRGSVPTADDLAEAVRDPPRRRAAAAGRSAAASATPGRPRRRSPSPRRTACRSWRPSPGAPWSRTTTGSTAGALGIIGATSANNLAAEADVVLAVGTRLQDFTTVLVDRLRLRRHGSSRSTPPASTPSSTRRRPWSATPGRRWSSWPRSSRAGRPTPTGPTAPPASGRVGRPRRRAAGGRRPGRRADLRPGRRRRQRRQRPGGLRAHRLRRDARRAARRLAHRRSSSRTASSDLGRDDGPGVRLLLHGLRGGRAVGCRDGARADPPRRPGHRALRRRLLPDAQLRALLGGVRRAPVRRGAVRQLRASR